MKYLVAAVALLIVPSVAFADDFDQRSKDVTRAQRICSQHVHGGSSVGGWVILSDNSIKPSAPVAVAYEDGWEKCYAVDKMAIDIKAEGEQRDRAFVEALKDGAGQ